MKKTIHEDREAFKISLIGNSIDRVRFNFFKRQTLSKHQHRIDKDSFTYNVIVESFSDIGFAETNAPDLNRADMTCIVDSRTRCVE